MEIVVSIKELIAIAFFLIVLLLYGVACIIEGVDKLKKKFCKKEDQPRD